MSLKFNKSTDSEHEVKLDSHLVSAYWTSRRAIAGHQATFEVNTEFVGDGAPIKIVGKSEQGKKLGKIKDVIRKNRFAGTFDLPEDLELGDRVYFEVKLKKNGLSGESERIPAYPPIRVSNMRWSAEEARRGDVLTLSADISGLQNRSEVTLVIYEYDSDSAHDKITELPSTVLNDKIETQWEYEYHEDTDRINTQSDLQPHDGQYAHPEYFFTIKVGETEYGREQESGLLRFKDWVDIWLTDENGEPKTEHDYILHLADGSQRRGNLGSSGWARERDVPPGRVRVEFPGIDNVALSPEGE